MKKLTSNKSSLDLGPGVNAFKAEFIQYPDDTWKRHETLIGGNNGKISQLQIFSSQILILLSQVVLKPASRPSRLLMQVSQPKIWPLRIFDDFKSGILAFFKPINPPLAFKRGASLRNYCLYLSLTNQSDRYTLASMQPILSRRG